ncbi:protein phosphatase 2C domain-containing protein [Streptomyces xantholiticus]|uniref:Protein phosphatase 2C domain-containing protein n=1 Tax=Streptomyces xantholiticus TaxID=68285 RepID=A0ABV1UXA5_9ACTN
MSEQGERPNRPTTEDEWWSRLYDDSAPDTGPPAVSSADTLDDRFDSASDTVTPRPAPWGDHPVTPPPDAPRRGATPTPPPRPVGPPDEPSAQAPPAAPAPPGADPVLAGPPGTPAAGPGQEAPPGRGGPAGAASAPPRPTSAPSAQGAPAVSDPRGADPAPADHASAAPAGREGPVSSTGEAPAPAQPRGGDTAGTPAPPHPEGGRPAGATPVAPDALPTRRFVVPVQAPRSGVVGGGPPTYDAEPTALPAAEAHALEQLVADTVLDGARYGTYTLRAASVRGDSARFRGEPRRDALLTARFGSGPTALVLVAVASGIRGAETAHLAAADACRWIGGAVGRSHARLAEDIRAGRRGDLKSGLHRLTDRSLGKLRARATELGLEPEAYTVGLRCLLLSADPDCRTRVFFGVGAGGLFRLRDGGWQDLEPPVPDRSDVTGAPVVGFGSAVPEATAEGDRLTMDLGIPTPASPYIEAPPPPPAEPFRFRASVARPGDTLLLCSNGLAEPVRGETAFAQELAERWRGPQPPGMAQFLADTQLRVKGYADDRTAVAVWEA